MNAIEFRNVSKKFKKGEQFDSLRDFIPNLVKGVFGKNNVDLHDKEFWAVKNVSFELKKGEGLGIIGPNGAGKSTILKMLSRILRPTEGGININGKLSALLEVGAGFHPDLTGRENIYLSGAIIGMRKKEIAKKIDSIIEFSELKDFIDTPVKRYSSGMYVRLGFSVAVHMEPEILLIDEVLAVGDMSFQNKCLRKIQEIRKSGITIIFISHNLEFIRRLCPTSIFLKYGKVNYYGKSADAIEAYMRSENCTTTSPKCDGVRPIDIGRDTEARISDIKLYDFLDKESTEFKTDEFMRIEISYHAKNKICNPTFTVGFLSDAKLYSDLNNRFEGYNISHIEGAGKINLIIRNIYLLPGLYEARIYLADKDAIGIYDMKRISFFVREQKRGFGLFYQPHRWEQAYKQNNREMIAPIISEV